MWLSYLSPPAKASLADARRPRNVCVRLKHLGEVGRGEFDPQLIPKQAQRICDLQQLTQGLPLLSQKGALPLRQLADHRT
jgi:hypothetical protein